MKENELFTCQVKAELTVNAAMLSARNAWDLVREYRSEATWAVFDAAARLCREASVAIRDLADGEDDVLFMTYAENAEKLAREMTAWAEERWDHRSYPRT